ncbi:MAG: hypothetical protein OR994_08825 [Candidatus Poseidoniales archaeon]|jgi:hypothetical protein|nr:hypothetical protein [Candidatus Poseidoniales archaeon]|tara:strand:+ start:2251 stop:2805 length:555 start_codon:yes stop_codon:yes gene_type:complete
MSGDSGAERKIIDLPEKPWIPVGLIDELKSKLTKKDAPFLKYLSKNLELVWIEKSEDRLGMTRFEYNANELFRRRKLRISCGPVTIGLNPLLNGDSVLYRHTLVHELLHASGLLDHGDVHADLVKKIAPPPKLSNSVVLQEMRKRMLEKLPERQWICGDCGYTWDRKRVTMPSRCPKCAMPFKS